MKKKGKRIIAIIMMSVILMTMIPMTIIAEAEETTYKVGSIIEYGNYPQSEVKDEELLSELNALSFEWKTMKSYCWNGSTNPPKEIDTIKYADVTYNGNKYRVVKNCGDKSTILTSTYDSKIAAKYGYTVGPYWFKYEPIRWKVLDPQTGYVISVDALDGQFYNVTPKENGLPRNDYATSDVRKWLNEDFYNTAFTNTQQKNIALTHNENLADQGTINATHNSGSSLYGKDVSREATDDYVYLPSWYDLTNSAYGYAGKYNETIDSRKNDLASDYARSQGIFSPSSEVYLNTPWKYAYYCILRTHGGSDGISFWTLDKYGSLTFLNDYTYTNLSIKPAMTLKELRTDTDLEEPEHTHVFDLTSSVEPTCTTDGQNTYTCQCGETYTETLQATGHKYSSAITTEATCVSDGERTFTCSVCNNTYTETLKATGHKYSSSVTKEATCVGEGERTFTCSACNDTYTETIPLVPHRYENDSCVVCGKLLNWDYVIDNNEVTITGYLGKEKEVRVPEKINNCPVTVIASSAFNRNGNIRYVYLPDSVKTIESNAFSECNRLNEVFIGSGMKTIGKNAFSQCRSLAVVCILAKNCSLKDAFSGADSRLIVTVPKGSQTEKNASATSYSINTIENRKKDDGKDVIAFGGKTVVYNTSEYHFWPELVQRFPNTYYLFFESITFDGVLADEFDFDNPNCGADGNFFKMEKVYISVGIDGEDITFQKLAEILQNGHIEAYITFETPDKKETIGQKIEGFITSVFKAISRVINKIFKIFK